MKEISKQGKSKILEAFMGQVMNDGQRLDTMRKEVIQILNLLGDIETRLEAFKVLLINKRIIKEKEYDSMLDDIRGLRVKTVEEPIEKEDIAWVDYECLEKEVVVFSEKNFPVRVGSGAIIIEEDLMGKKSGESISIDKNYPANYSPNPQLAGKSVTFRIVIGKVKTRKGEQKCQKRSSLRERLGKLRSLFQKKSTPQPQPESL
jgi:hypothetical protein